MALARKVRSRRDYRGEDIIEHHMPTDMGSPIYHGIARPMIILRSDRSRGWCRDPGKTITCEFAAPDAQRHAQSA